MSTPVAMPASSKKPQNVQKEDAMWLQKEMINANGTFIVTDCATRDDDSRPYHEQMPRQPLIELTADGERIGASGLSGAGAGEFVDCPHSIWIGPGGEVYVSEVISHNRLQKFAKSSR